MNHQPKILHQEYLKKLRIEKIKVRLVQLIILISFFGLWEYAAQVGWINRLMFSQPTKIWGLFLTKISDGTLLATMIWWSPFLDKVLEPYLVVLNSMPKVALGPILIVGFGPGFLSIMAMAVAITIIITTIVIYSSFKEVDPNYIKLIRSFGGTKIQSTKK
jgi:NitT/TauT family transport system permease protein